MTPMFLSTCQFCGKRFIAPNLCNCCNKCYELYKAGKLKKGDGKTK